jgi:hypothetical protein
MATTYKWSIKTGNKVEQAARLLRIYCVLNNINPSDTSILVCAYIMVYGLSNKVKDAILKAGVLGTPGSLQNEIHKIRKMGLLEGVEDKTRISRKIVPEGMQALTPQTLMIINLDNR